jgi:hypothetical protein
MRMDGTITATTASADSASDPVAANVAMFLRLVCLWNEMWNEAGYGSAGLKIRRGLIVFFALIFLMFVLEVGVAEANLADHQLLEGTAVAALGTVGVAAPRSNPRTRRARQPPGGLNQGSRRRPARYCSDNPGAGEWIHG